ncbi:MAG: hypothetical protein ACTHLW_03360 [Verrucomicrobiota bacterium]
MKSDNQVAVWAASVWALVLAIALTYYLIRSWRRGRVTFPARVPAGFSRDENPGMFWFAMTIYFVFDGFAIICVLFRGYVLLKAAA